jgi:cytochrome c biogenesis protein CcmG/thiol:disulfide interchange protein DsbE
VPPWRRFYLNVAAVAGGLVVVIALLFVLSSGASWPTRATAVVSAPGTAIAPRVSPSSLSPDTIAVVNGEPVTRAEWLKIAALDRVMSQLSGQPSPSAEATLDRLVNQRLVLQLAGETVASDLLAAERLALLQQNWRTDDATVNRMLSSAGLARQDLVAEVKRLLVVEAYLKQIAATQDPTAWLAARRAHAQVGIYADLTESAPTPVAQATAPAPMPTPTPALSIPTGSAVGQLAPDFVLADVSGQRTKLNDLRGRPVAVNFWASWCPACRQELPALQAAYQRFRERGVILLGVDVKESVETVASFAPPFGLTFPLLLDLDGAVSDRYQVRGIPTTVFLDAEGIVRARHVGPLTEDKFTEYVSPLIADSKSLTSSLKAAPDFSLPRENGQTVRLSDYRDKSSVVLVFYRGQT